MRRSFWEDLETLRPKHERLSRAPEESELASAQTRGAPFPRRPHRPPPQHCFYSERSGRPPETAPHRRTGRALSGPQRKADRSPREAGDSRFLNALSPALPPEKYRPAEASRLTLQSAGRGVLFAGSLSHQHLSLPCGEEIGRAAAGGRRSSGSAPEGRRFRSPAFSRDFAGFGTPAPQRFQPLLQRPSSGSARAGHTARRPLFGQSDAGCTAL